MSNRNLYRNTVKGIGAIGVIVVIAGCTANSTSMTTTTAKTDTMSPTAAQPGDSAATARIQVAASPGAYTYHHWPEANVYFDPQRDVFFWQEGRQQRTGADLPATIMDNLGGAVVVTLDSANPLANSDGLAVVEIE